MELKDFIEKSLIEIIEGVKAASSHTKAIARRSNTNALSPEHKTIKFKISVTTESSGGAGAKISVLSAKIGAEGSLAQSNLNELTFQIPIDFSQARAEAGQEE